MALVVLLRGVNVGGHRRLRPAALAARMRHLGVVSIGAAGTFVVQTPIDRATLHAEFVRRLPFTAHIAICRSRDLVALLSRDVVPADNVGPDIVRFVSVLSRPPRSAPSLPMDLPATGPWLVRLLAREGRFVVGLYRRHMRTIGQLGELDRIFGVTVTTRNWTTITAIAQALARDGGQA